MSVLKYNNNGTWEGLNIDHASTADSCLYDANGNVITSTYATKSELPTKVSQLQNDSNFITSAGAPVQSVNGQTGTVSLTIPTNTNQLTNGAGFITSSALTSYLPLSAGSGKKLTGDLYLGSHDVHRTPKTYSANQISSKSLSSGNNKICTATISEAGVYIISASTHIAMTGGGNAYINIYKSNDNTSKIIYDNHYVKAGSTWVGTMTWATFNAGQYCSMYIEVTTSCTIDNAYLELVRLG